MSTMTVGELISQLEDLDAEAEVRLAHQPSWPFEYSIDSVVEVGGDDDECEECGFSWSAHDEGTPGYCGCEVEPPRGSDNPTIVYIAEGSQLGYLPGQASRQLGWRD